MPYFKRYPFADMQKAPPRAPILDSADILGTAFDVLSQEDAKPPTEGPFRLRSVLHPGDTGQIVLGVAAPDDGPTTTIRFMPGDLVSSAGRIDAAHLTIEPSSLALGPGQAQDVLVRIAAPSDLPSGRYVGVLTASGEHGFVAALEVLVQG